MIKQLTGILILILAITMVSCSGERPLEPEDQYLFLHEGNQWIYQNVEINANGKEFILPEEDSIIVTNKIEINNKTYYQLYWKGNYSNVRIDSTLGRLVDEYDHIIIDTKTFNTEYKRDSILDGSNQMLIAVFSYKMEKIPEISVPAGQFQRCINGKATIDLKEPYNKFSSTRYTESVWAPNVGKVVDRFFGDPNSPTRFERRLLRYKIYN
jgi:hypothetical protein